MEPLKPRDKITQHMTRDGLTLDNQTTGESVNVSSREAEQEYTAQPEGAAEKILERADELHDRHKAKKAAKDTGETVAQATGPVPGCSLPPRNGPPRSWPRISKKGGKTGGSAGSDQRSPAEKARRHQRKPFMTRPRARPKSRLYFDKVEKAPPQLKPNPASRPIQEAGLYLHGKIHEVEHENVGVEGGHKGGGTGGTAGGPHDPQRRPPPQAQTLPDRSQGRAKVHRRQRRVCVSKIPAGSPGAGAGGQESVSRFWQKQHIKREYAKAARAAGQTAQGGRKHRQDHGCRSQESHREKADRPRPLQPGTGKGR